MEIYGPVIFQNNFISSRSFLLAINKLLPHRGQICELILKLWMSSENYFSQKSNWKDLHVTRALSKHFCWGPFLNWRIEFLSLITALTAEGLWGYCVFPMWIIQEAWNHQLFKVFHCLGLCCSYWLFCKKRHATQNENTESRPLQVIISRCITNNVN